MPRDAIMTIKESEAKAKAIEAEAHLEAKQMIEETEASCIRFCEKEKEKLSSELCARIEDIGKKSDFLIEKSARATEEEAEELRKKASIRLSGAVKIILQEIEKQCLWS